MKDNLLKEFRQRFQRDPEHIFFCPGRINLIGEHIDYNGGKVMPCAISLGTYLAVAKNKDAEHRFQAIDFPESAVFPVQNKYSKDGKEWYYYPLGVINELAGKGHVITGLDMLFCGNLPIGSGLSSSASIEVLTAYTINELFDLKVSKIDMALLSKKVENEFIGVNCGIMDQFAVAMGQQNNAILLDCDTIEYEYLPLKLADHVLAIVNTNKPRKLAESKYNERFAECRKALAALQKELDIQNLCDINESDFEKHRGLINDEVLEKRALHVISENDRVKKAVRALRSNDLTGFGKLMYASHQSLKELYEVSGKELDTIVEFCKTFDGCIGARMTGAGFGGCAIALVKSERFGDFAAEIPRYYNERIGYDPGVFSSQIGDGAKEIKL